MKNNKTAVVLLTLIASMASIAQAEKGIVDFDKGTFNVSDFMETARAYNICDADKTASAKVAPEIDLDSAPIQVYKLSPEMMPRFRKAAVDMGLSNEFLKYANEEKTTVLYNNTKVLLVMPVGELSYVVAESDDIGLVTYLAKQKSEAWLQGSSNKQIYMCVTKIETVMKWINYIWTAVQVSREICSWQNEGTTPSTGNPGGSGGTYHNGQGDNSNYDVNKHLK